MKIIRAAISAVFALTLAACGGGSSDSSSSTATAPNTAEGFWIGTSSTGYSVAVAVLENGETWGLYSSGNVLYGALNGNVVGSGSTVTGSGTEYNLASRATSSATVTGTVAAKSSLSLATNTNTRFTGTYRTQYDQAASLSTIAGSYTGWGVSGTSTTQSTPITISTSGGISAGSTSLGCAASGTAVPRPSGKNIFNISVTFTGSNCALGNGVTTTGIAVLDTSVTPSRLYALALKSDKSDGFIWTGTR